MPRQVPRDTTEIIQPVLPRDAAGGLIGAIDWDDPDLAIDWAGAGSVAWTPIALTAGTLGTWSAGGWSHLGGGCHMLGMPPEAITPGESTIIRLTYDHHPPQFDTIDAVIPPPVDTAGIAGDVLAGLQSTALLMGGIAQFATDSELNLVQGDTYTAASGTAWEKRITQPGFDFTDGGLAVRFGAGTEAGLPIITGTASLVDRIIGAATLRLEFARHDTAAVAAGSYQWDAELYHGSLLVRTIDAGVLYLHPSWTALS